MIFLARGALNADNCFADASVLALHAGDGALAWAVSLRDAPSTLSGDPGEPCSTAASTTAAEGGRVWAPWNAFRTHSADSAFSRLLAFDLATGTLVAAIPPPVPTGFVRAMLSVGCPRPTGDIDCMTEPNVYAHDRALASLGWQLPVGRDTVSHDDGEGGFDFTTPIATSAGTAVMALRARGRADAARLAQGFRPTS